MVNAQDQIGASSLQSSANCSTLVELLTSQAEAHPDLSVFTFLEDGENETSVLTLLELDRQARAIGAQLQTEGFKGERALLLFPPGLDFIAAFFGCLYAGMVAVPAYPPRSTRGLSRLMPILKDAGPGLLLTCSALHDRLRRWPVPGLMTLPSMTTDQIDLALAEQWLDPAVTGGTLAFLQYTSGSTGSPKGVMISHRNALHNQWSIKSTFQQDESSVVVGWLPLFHDMGLIGNVLQPLYNGARCVLMPPTAFLQNPVRWLKCISRYRATTSGGPNFAYQLCVDRITPGERQGLALDSWTVAFNGAEPVRYETLKRFAETFEPCGFSSKAFYPCYGLAEATLLVAGRNNSTEVAILDSKTPGAMRSRRFFGETVGALPLVSSGQVVESADVIIVDPETSKRCAAGEKGEIWLKGPSVAQGYWNKREETDQVFKAHLSDESPSAEGPFLRTGDLGFLDDGNLFITGRLKDLIIIRGRNLYPQDIELSVEQSHPALRLGVGAAFSVDAEVDERLVVVQEIDSHAATTTGEIAQAARRAAAEIHEVQLNEIVFVRAGSLPRTTSGKIQRHVCRSMYLAGTLRIVDRSRVTSSFDELANVGLSREVLSALPASERRIALQNHLRALVGRALRASSENVDKERPLVSLGLDSLLAVELQHSLEEQLEIRLPMSTLLGGGSIASLAEQALIALGSPAIIRATSKPAIAEYPLSYGQRALWFLNKLAPNDGAYNLAAAVRIIGPLNGSALKEAFQTLTNRHASLRTNFGERDGQPVQWVHNHRIISFEESDASTWDEGLLDDRLAEEANRAFDLNRDPLLRVRLFRKSPEISVLILVAHHIVADFYSLEILIQELTTLYRYHKSDEDGALPPLNLQYADYVQWQEQMLSSPEGKQGWEYWRSRLSDELPVLNLPANRVRPAIQTYCGASVGLSLEADLTERLKILAGLREVTFFTLLLAAFQVLLHRYTGQENLIVGSPTTGRVSHDFARLVGYLVNPVPLRANLTGNPKFGQLLKQVGQTVLEALKHQHYPFPLMVERLECVHDPSRSPVFQTMFVLQKTTRPELEELAGLALGVAGARMQVGELSLESVQLQQRASQFDLTLIVAEVAGGLSLSLQYNTDLFDRSMAERVIAHYRNILEGIVISPDQPIRDLPLLSASEHHELLVELNDTARHFPSHQCIHQLVEAQAERTPDAVALIFEDRSVSYRELNRRANRVARRLSATGVAPEQKVGVLLERSIEMVVAMLGVLKAGGAYVPIESDYPVERIAFMLEDAEVVAVLTEARHHGLLRLPERVQVLDVTPDPESAVSQPNPTNATVSDNLAYIIYTSGSTGQPKGVAISHRSAVALLYWAREIFGPEDLKRVLASTSICFDLSVFELFAPLSWGGAVRLAKNLLELSTLKDSEHLTLINTVPSVLAELLRDGRFPAGVRTVNLAGEALNPRLVDETYRRMQAGRVLNLYGPSEDTTYSCYSTVAAGTRSVPIGRPVANTQAYILDEQLQPVPRGVIGELYLGGAGLARGYHSRPELTAERFIPNPFRHGPGERLYRTGDLARHLEDGQLEFLGRADHQVKLRGFRIELGEIETVLSRHSGVREAVAVVREDTSDDKRLVAYIVAQDGYEHSLTDLRGFLRERLPVHMLPTAFVVLKELPLTSNGKLNRRALPAPEGTTSKSWVAPSTGIEKTLCAIWSELLNVERVSVNDDFFDLGGHSLLAARLTSRVRQTFDVELSLRSVFTNPTISGLAAVIESSRNGGSAPPIKPVSREQTHLEQTPDVTENVDRRAAPDSQRILLRPAGAYTAPRTDAEELLANIWVELLNLERVSVHDDFFEVGGYSLLAARLASRIRQSFNVEISLKSVFESPTVAQLAQLIAVSPRVESSGEVQQLRPTPAGLSYPLSYPQQRLWFLHCLEPESPAYNLPGAIRLSGHLDSEVLRRSLNEIVRRHESLRTRFIVLDGQPRQFIESAESLEMRLIDLDGLQAEERDIEMRRLMRAEAHSPFDLTKCPLLRTTLLRLSEAEYVLLLTLHHIVADGWSLGVLAREVGALYRAFLVGDQSPLPELRVQYVDFAVWQQRWLTAEKLEGHLAYWKSQLERSPSLLDLPTDRPRPTVQIFRGANQTLELSADLSRRINGLSREHGVTLFMTLLAAFKVLLYQYTRQADLLVGTPIANRSRLETEELIGCFVNTLVLRNDLSGNPSFRNLLQPVRKTTLEAFEHLDVPFEKLVEELQPERSLSHSPLFQVMFVLQDIPTAALDLPGLSLKSLEVDSGTAKYDLTLSVSDTNALFVRLEYNTDLFDDATAARLLAHYRNILDAVANNPDLSILDVQLLTPEERHQLLIEWNDTRVAFSRPQFIHQLIERQAESQPEAVAVVFEDEQLTYGELNRRANQLAHHLRRLGVGAETFVGICLERSLEMVWGLLGILKAGGAYVPFDPAYPRERLSYMLEDSQVALILTQQRLGFDDLLFSQRVLLLDADATSFGRESGENPPCILNFDSAAYAIYTSGSTGQPKAAINTHRAIANRLLWMQDTYHLTRTDCVLQKTPFSFDVSVWEFFWPLLAGARLIVARPGGHLDSSCLVELISDHDVTTVHFVPSMLQIFLEDPEVERCDSLRQVFCSGEALPFGLMQRFFEELGARLHNLYGPTEAAIDVTSWTCKPLSARQSVPIGRPVANTQIYLLNPELQPVPVGVAAELYIGGVSLARGYFNRAALTAERFIPDPFSKQPGARLYKTGDMCRRLTDGNIEFLGRLDHQVKVRGFRIEPGEIEAALETHPMVREVVVSVREDRPNERRLVAYLAVENALAPTSTDFRQYLKERLPDYMVPSAFCVLASLPRTVNGKIDRLALPRPDLDHLAQPDPYAGPKTPTEMALAGVWSRVLDLEKIGIHDNFFEAGGDSILSMKVVISARQLGIKLKPKDVFAHQTIAELAAFADSSGHDSPVETLAANVVSQSSVEIQPGTLVGHETFKDLPASGLDTRAPSEELENSSQIEDVYPLTPVQEGMLFHSAYSPESELYFEQLSLTLRGRINTAAFEGAWQKLVNRHAILRTAFVWESVSEPVQVVRRNAQLPFKQYDWRDLSEAEQQDLFKKLLRADRARGFDCSVAPLMRLSLIRLAEETYALIWSHHHMLLDGWSKPLLLSEFLAIYEALCIDRPLPSHRVRQFGNYLSWLKQQDMAKAEAYWRQTLEGFAAPTALAIHPKVPDSSGRDEEHEPLQFLLLQDLTASLVAFARKHHLTLSTLVQGAWALLLGHYSGEDDVVFGVTVSGRPTDLEGSESMVGMFINTLPLRVVLRWEENLLPWLKQIQTQQSELIEYGYTALVRVQRWSDVPRGARLFESIVVFQNYPVEHSLQDVNGSFAVSQVRAYETTKYSLMLVVEPGAELSLKLLYDGDRFDSYLAARMLRHLQRLLESISSDARQSLASIPLLTESERRQLLIDWNDKQIDFPNQCVHEVFEAQARRTPEAAALTFGERSLSYRELNAQANQLAHHLHQLGVGSQSPVGLCVERSIDLVTGLLAILKAGGVFVPLNPQYPSEQLAYMMADSQAEVLITHGSTSERVPLAAARVVNLDDERGAINQCSDKAPANDVRPEQLAYVIYTSGSTGKPKGVLIEHRNLANTLRSSQISFNFRPDDVMACVSAFSFDIFLFELLGPLLSGGRCLLLANDALMDAALVSKTLSEVTVIHAVPTLMRQLIVFAKEDPTTGLGRRVRRVFVGGDAVPPELITEIQEVFPLARIDVLYGPTEATIICAHHTVEKGRAIRQEMIGKPMHNVRLRLCDKRGNVVPVGVKGEIYIGGAGVTRGYLNNEMLTKEKYVFIDGERYYRSGDLGSWLPDGSIAFAGRSDQQIKVRGFRIELGEVEAALVAHPKLSNAVVMAQEDGKFDRRLVAYVVPKDGLALSTSELRRYLRERLPEHMLPSAFVVLGDLPLTPHGKVDRRALPAPQQSRPELSEAYAVPRTPLEETLAEIWVQVLEVDPVGIHDSFFELGGDSILSIRVIARARQKGIHFSARQLFQHPTIAELASILEEASLSSLSTKKPEVAAENTEPSQHSQSRYQDSEVTQRELDHLLAKITRTTK